MRDVAVRPYEQRDVKWAEELIGGGFGGRLQARRGGVVDALALPGLVAEEGGRRVGILTYQSSGDETEIAYLEVTDRWVGIGSALIRAFLDRVECRRVWLVTTNDNTDALRFYQRRGFRLSEVRIGAVTEARRHLKPSIGEIGFHFIALRDELELEMILSPSP